MPANSSSKQLKTSLEIVTEKIEEWVSAFFYYLPNIIIAVLILVAFIWLSKKVQKWSYRALDSLIKVKTTKVLLSQFFGSLFVLLGLILSLSILGLDQILQTVLAGAGLAGLAVGLALQFPLSNTFSGLFLATENDIFVGNWIETAQYAGEIIEIDSRSTKIKEADNNIVVIPNKTLVENPFKNFALTNRIRTSIRATVSFEADLDLVKKICVEAIVDRYPNLKKEDIEFYYMDFKEIGIELLLRFYLDDKNTHTALEVKSESILSLKKAFDTHNIKVPVVNASAPNPRDPA